jgi:hypothetical protein
MSVNRALWAAEWKTANASFAAVAAFYDLVCVAFDE